MLTHAIHKGISVNNKQSEVGHAVTYYRNTGAQTIAAIGICESSSSGILCLKMIMAMGICESSSSGIPCRSLTPNLHTPESYIKNVFYDREGWDVAYALTCVSRLSISRNNGLACVSRFASISRTSSCMDQWSSPVPPPDLVGEVQEFQRSPPRPNPPLGD